MICRECKIEKSLDNFHKKTGVLHHTICKECRKGVIREHYINNKEKYRANKLKTARKNARWFLDYKKTLKCCKCEEDHPACLDFHHIDPLTKSFSISTSFNRYKRELVLEEIKKCLVICANCHRKLHWSMERLESESSPPGGS